MQKIKAKGQSVRKTEWKEMEGGDCITFRASSVGKKYVKMRFATN